MGKNYLLTKSKYIRGLQCVKALYFDVYHPKWAHYDKETLKKFGEGRDFESDYKATFPGGIALNEKLGRQTSLYPEATADLLSSDGEVVIFEAGFLYNEVLVLADVVRKNSDGSLDIFEVKHSSQLKEVFQRDTAIQHYVIAHNTNPIRNFYIVHSNEEGGFVQADVLPYCQAQMAEIEENVARFKTLLRGQEPYVAIGDHCDKPYPCPYRQHCEQSGSKPLFGLFGG